MQRSELTGQAVTSEEKQVMLGLVVSCLGVFRERLKEQEPKESKDLGLKLPYKTNKRRK
jgi:hypothetical protein